MSSVLGVSVGASAVRLAHPELSNREGSRFLSQLVDHGGRAEELAAESIGVVLTGDADPGRVHHAGVAYRDQALVEPFHAAMARQNLRNYQLIPEIEATLRALEHSGVLGSATTPLIYDLGSSGLTISVVDRATGDVVETRRTTVVGGDLFDRIIRDSQVGAARLRVPRTEAESRALDAQCRNAKEQLSRSGAVCVPGEGGLLLLSRDVFDSLITVAVEASARLVREVVSRVCGRPDVVVLVGGGAHMPLVRSIIESWVAIPVVVPEEPELTAAQGAAMLASASGREVARTPEAEPDWAALLAAPTRVQKQESRKRKSAAIVGSVAVLCVLGIGAAVGAVMIPNPTEGEAIPDVPVQPVPSATAPPPPPSPSAPPPRPPDMAPIQTWQPQPTIEVPEPAPPPPPPPPLFPGLPRIELPPLQLPEFPRFPG